MTTVTAIEFGRTEEGHFPAGCDVTFIDRSVPSPQHARHQQPSCSVPPVPGPVHTSRLTDLLRRRQEIRRGVSEVSSGDSSRVVAGATCAAPPVAKPSFTQVSAEPCAGDRRRFPRRASRAFVRALKSSDQPPVHPSLEWSFRSDGVRGDLIDISMNGALFITTEAMENDSSLLLQLTHTRHGFIATRRSRVVRCEAEGADRWKITCCFDHCLTLDEVIQLGNAWS